VLDILRSIIQEVNSAQDLDQALDIIVRRVKLSLHVDVCSIYIVDHQSELLILMASDGLKQGAIGKVRLGFDQGLVGLVALRAEPLNLDNAPDHPNYLFVTETGEQRYHAFLGVPIIHHRQVLGVLVLRQVEAVRYSEETVTFLITIAAQLAAAIIHAEASGGILKPEHQQAISSWPLIGLPGAPGVAIGRSLVVHNMTDIDSIPDRSVEDTKPEQQRFLEAVRVVKQEVQQMVANMQGVLPSEEIALFDAYLLMLDSDSLIGEINNGIQAGNWAPGAVREVIGAHVRIFDDMEDPYFRERAEDIRDLGQRILEQLDQKTKRDKSYTNNTILVGEEISASTLAKIPLNKLAGVVSVRGSSTSHTAILARALGVPAVLGVKDLPLVHMDDLDLIVDGYSGHVYVNASTEIVKEYKRLKKEEQALSRELQDLRDLDSVTTDGIYVPLYANTGLISDISTSLNSGAEGVGLYRTEFPFMVRNQFPGEEEQSDIYRYILQAFAPRPVTMRTLDIGGDKALHYFPIKEDNPFLGWRGIRITLDHPDIFLVQIRAMLRANVGLNNLRLMLPMISTLHELDEAMHLIHRAHEELLEEGHDIILPQIGAMVEVPSLIYQIEPLAKRVDFISIGSNDLTQYLLAVDRNNGRVAKLYDYLHPSVIHAIKYIVVGAKKQRIPVSVCGEMAGDPMAAIILLGLGINTLSMNASSLLRIKWVIRTFSRRRAKAILKKSLEMEEPQAIRDYLGKILDKAGLGGLIRAGK
jgi:phosphotransferase system enzyme I (PtsP)